ncbi:hypothetical protein J4E85_006507 [Alternaria conjuncta]|uniref:uncharacterized protein n=1 Tax=Alternaria conjuncta TaxID=181017 RepID=UPI0022201968|nr:uncharacterized protein J4E85_006507 [Alternaria conjuncta]KAI4926215.1 hypothetical protein J4E85_006507 [Alternaria conjuncta]
MPAKNAINGVFVESLEEMSTNVNHRRPSPRRTNPPAAQTELSATQFKEPDYRDGTFVIEPQEAAFANDFDFKSSATSSTQNTGKETLLLECPLGDVSGKDESYIKSIKVCY